MNQYLALDVGGTKTHIALYSITDNSQLNIIKEKKYRTQEATNLEEILLDFLPRMESVDAIGIALAGPVVAAFFWNVQFVAGPVPGL